MSSLIPETTVGIDSRKYRRNQSCMVHGTSEIGYVFPTYARNYINDATINLGTRTGVRLSPLFVPTMGKLDVRHYHCFVPWNRVYSPFDAFLAREPFNFEGGTSIPQYLPKIKMGEIITGLFFIDSLMPNYGGRGIFADSGASFGEWIQSGQLNVGLTCSIYKASADDQTDLPVSYELVDWQNDQTHNELLNGLFSGLLSSFFGYTDNYGHSVCSVIPSMLRTTHGDYFVNAQNNGTSSSPIPVVVGLSSVSDGSRSHIVSEYLSSISYPSLENCDFSYEVRSGGYGSDYYQVCFNFNGALKRLRSICLGLGYSFNPFDMESDCMLKFLAFYRAWFSLFGVTRDINFNDTAAASISRLFTTFYTQDDWRVYGSFIPLNNADNLMYDFFKSLCDLTYTCPSDYFTSSVQNTQQGVSNDAVTINGDTTGYSNAGSMARTDLTPSAFGITDGNGSAYVSAISIQIAQRLLRWVNKNTVVGRKIADILYARFGKIQTDDDSSEGVYKIGVDTTPIEIGIIFNQTSSEGSAPLGEFSGIGSGGSRAPRHTFNTPSYGVFITLTAVVPEMGYFQGKLRENSDGIRDSFEFPDTAFDALGWQTVRYNELVSDRQFHRQGDANSSGTSLGIYGRQPRYTHYKVGFNRVLGDISLPHMASNMLSYTLDRYFNPRDEYLPVNNPATSRRGTIGGTNRIFEVVSPTDDHIIYQIYFDINVNDRLKPLSLSYDTILEGDDKSADFGHE